MGVNMSTQLPQTWICLELWFNGLRIKGNFPLFLDPGGSLGYFVAPFIQCI